MRTCRDKLELSRVRAYRQKMSVMDRQRRSCFFVSTLAAPFWKTRKVPVEPHRTLSISKHTRIPNRPRPAGAEGETLWSSPSRGGSPDPGGETGDLLGAGAKPPPPAEAPALRKPPGLRPSNPAVGPSVPSAGPRPPRPRAPRRRAQRRLRSPARLGSPRRLRPPSQLLRLPRPPARLRAPGSEHTFLLSCFG